MDFLRLPFFDALADAQTVLLAGAGGGFDVFSALPLYFGLKAAGKTVHLANLSFTTIYASSGKRHGPALVEVSWKTKGDLRYFPERHLTRWFYEERDEEVPVFCFDRTGARPIAEAYRNLVALLGGVDAVVLVDGGTDSLMRGDEAGLGTPEEDSASIYAVDRLEGVPTKLLVCIGFGVDTFHGVCHAQFLEAVADLIRSDAYLGAWSLVREMPEVQLYERAVAWTNKAMFNHPSIVCSSIVSAIDGRFGDHHATHRTSGSTLFINPLMSLCWAFRLDAVARRNLYLGSIGETESWQELSLAIHRFRARTHDRQRTWQDLPM